MNSACMDAIIDLLLGVELDLFVGDKTISAKSSEHFHHQLMFPAAQAHPLQELQVASNPSNEKQCFFEARAHTFRRFFLPTAM